MASGLVLSCCSVFFILIGYCSDSFSTVTFKNDLRILHKALDIFESKISLAKKKAVGTFVIATLIQPIPTIFSQHSVERGGNVLGLDRAKDNLVCE